MYCTGQGDPDLTGDPFEGGCCIMSGGICPIRRYIDYSTSADYNPAEPNLTTYEIDTATIIDAAGNPVVFANGGSTADDWARELVGNSPPQRTRVKDQLQGTRYVCQGAVQGVVDDFNNIVVSPTQINGPAFEAAWLASAPYTTAQLLPDGTTRSPSDYWAASGDGHCPNWVGVARAQCCFGTDQATHDSRAANLSVTRRTMGERQEG